MHALPAPSRLSMIETTGWVRVDFVHAPSRVVHAPTFADAAAKIECGRGDIRRFTWINPPE